MPKITPTEARVLNVCINESPTASEIGKKLRMSYGAVRPHINSLLNKGLLFKSIERYDGNYRYSAVTTGRGAEFFAKDVKIKFCGQRYPFHALTLLIGHHPRYFKNVHPLISATTQIRGLLVHLYWRSYIIWKNPNINQNQLPNPAPVEVKTRLTEIRDLFKEYVNVLDKILSMPIYSDNNPREILEIFGEVPEREPMMVSKTVSEVWPNTDPISQPNMTQAYRELIEAAGELVTFDKNEIMPWS